MNPTTVHININFGPATDAVHDNPVPPTNNTSVVNNYGSVVINAGLVPLPTQTGSSTYTTNTPVMPLAKRRSSSPSTEQPMGESSGAIDEPHGRHTHLCVHQRDIIDRLDQKALASMMTRVVAKYPYVWDVIHAKYPTELAQARCAQELTLEPKITFANLDRAAWNLLNTKNFRDSCHYEDGSSCGVNEIASLVVFLAKHVSKSVPYRTKKLAMWTLHNIGRSVILSPGELGNHVRNNFGNDDDLTNTMRSIAKSMSPDERLRLGRSRVLDGTTFNDKLWQLAFNAQDHDIFQDLEGVAMMFDKLTYMKYDTSSGDDLDEQSEDDAGTDEDSDSQCEDNTSGDESLDPLYGNAIDSGEDQSRPRKRHRSA